MEIELISFGKISEVIANQKIVVTEVIDTDSLKSFLEIEFPELKKMKYKLAMNKQLIQQNTAITNNANIAIMPPFSGG